MVWIKKLLKWKIKIIFHSRDRDRSATHLFSMLATSNSCVDEELYSDTRKTLTNNVLFAYGLFDVRRIGQVNLWVFPTISLARTCCFEENVRRHCLALCEEMRDEIRRLMSFANSNVNASPIRLASAGFFATGVGDGTMCFSCGIMHTGWQWGSNPATIHRNISPDCLHAAGHDDRNVPLIPFSLPAPAAIPRRERQHVGDARTTTDTTGVHSTHSGETNVASNESRPQFMPQSDTTGNRNMRRLRRLRQVVGDTQSSQDANVECLPWERPGGTTDFQLHDSPENTSFSNKEDRLDPCQRLPQDHCEEPQDSPSAEFLYTGTQDSAQSIHTEKDDNPSEAHLFGRSPRGCVDRKSGLQLEGDTRRTSHITREKEHQVREDENEGATGCGTSNWHCTEVPNTESVYPELLTPILARAFEGEKIDAVLQEGDEMEEVALTQELKEEDLETQEEEGATGYTLEKRSNTHT